MDKKIYQYKAIKIDMNEEIFGDYLIKDPIFGWKLATTGGEYRIHADSIMKLRGINEDSEGVYRSLIFIAVYQFV